jgi:hypothetical protein
MSDALKKRGTALEEDYFQRKEREAIERLAKQQPEAPRLSPVSGKPMEQKVLHGVVIDQCPVTGGVWLDAGELEQLVEVMKQSEKTWLDTFLLELFSSFKGK